MTRLPASELARVEGDYRYSLGRERFRPRSALGMGREIRRLHGEGYSERDIGEALRVAPEVVREALCGPGDA